MKLIAFNYRKIVRIFPVLFITGFLLEGCCLFPGFEVAKRPCNCKDGPVIAKKNKTLPPPEADAKQAVATSNSQYNSAVENKEIPGIVPALHPLPAAYINDALTQSKIEAALASFNIANKPAERKLPLGIKGITTSIIAGPTISFKSTKEDYGASNHKNKPGTGVVLGIGNTLYFSETFAVNASLLFKSNNASDELSYTIPGDPGSPGGGGGSSSITKTKTSYSYLSAPILAQIKISNQLTAVVGPEINYLLGASEKPSGYGEKTKITDNSVRVGVGAQAGLRYDFPESPLGIQLLYDQRISSLNKKTQTVDYYPGGGGGSSYEIPAVHMGSVQVGVTCALCELMKKNRR